MSKKNLSVADALAIKNWEIIGKVILSNSEKSLADAQQAFAEAVWIKAFEAGYQKGLESLDIKAGPVQPEALMADLQEKLSNSRNRLVIAQSAQLMKDMYALLSPEDRSALGVSILAHHAVHRKERPALRLVSTIENMQ